jgi:glycine/D-amino acid oxidase-like deaminating enzyme
VLAAGSWSKPLAHDVGVILPMMSNKHSYVVTDVVKELKNVSCPNLRFFDESIYITVRTPFQTK